MTDVQTMIPAGLYAMTSNGELGVYDAQRQLQIDEPLTRAFAEHNRAFLGPYLNNGSAGDLRIAILFEAQEARVWGRLTLSLEDTVVRDLYPTSGHAAGVLTTFQQKSREQSVYRGMELLLDYRRESTPELPIFCPVLFIPNTTLAARVSALIRPPAGSEGKIPVIDVLNLAATVPPAQRSSPAILALVEKLRRGVIRKDQRSNSRLSLQHADMSKPDPSQSERGVSSQQNDEGGLHKNQRVESIECWLTHPHQSASAEQLRGFAQFRGYDGARLAALAARCSIYRAPPGQRLLERGQRDRWNLYLLEGSLSLIAADGAVLRADAGTDRAARAIAALKPRQYVVETLTPVSFLWVHDLQL